jgi:predicted RNase H-like nuclease
MSFQTETEVKIRIAEIDLAWGERQPDGVCALEASSHGARVITSGRTRGDDELLGWVARHLGTGPAFLTVDAPLVCPNPTGARPVDALTHVRFGKFHAGCHPANSTRCPRPPRVAAKFVERGFRLGWDGLPQPPSPRLIAEVYPHPAMVRLFGLSERIPYKRGPARQRRAEFRRLQRFLQSCLREHFPKLRLDAVTEALLQAAWTKNVEDQTDAFFCALIGYWHWLHRGAQTEVLGDLATGFILIPRP